MERKNTDQLQQELMTGNDLDRVLADNGSSFQGYALQERLQALFQRREISKTALARQSGISEVYLHQVFSGRRTPSRNRLLCLCFGLTMGAELMNTAVERLCDKTARGYDSMVKDAKDIAAAAVFVCAAACVAVGFFVFLVHGALLTALRFLAARLWLLMLMIVTVPAAVWFVFFFGRKQ